MCVSSNKFYEMIISFVKLRRIHKECIRFRNEVREIKTKMYHLKQQLLRAEHEKKKN